MRKLILPIAVLAPLLALTACDHYHSHNADDDVGISNPVVPAGGVDFGVMSHFDHDYASRDISSSSDQDGFEFSLAEDSVVVISMTGYGGFDGFLDLYDSNFGFITGDDNGGPSPDPLLVGTLGAGDYFFVAGGSGSSTGSYDVDISVEPLGGSDFGVMVSSDSFIDNGAAIDDAFDVDSFILTVYSNLVGDFYVTTTSGSFDGNLEILDEYGTQLLYDDPSGNADPAAINIALTPGTYIVRVGASSGSGDYSMQIDVN
ncbi:MAG: hypothetical protein KDB82_05645 [Planctomycetes bacterium]|nr:hypothetical protein [Planctomycetota bacterium]